MEILRGGWVPYTRAQREKNPEAEFLITQDNLKAYRNIECLDFLKRESFTLAAFFPQKPPIMSRLLMTMWERSISRQLIYKRHDEWERSLVEMKVSASEERCLTIKWLSEAIDEWNTSYLDIGIGAADRTGLRLILEGECKIAPVRFPTDYSASLVPGHPKYDDCIPFGGFVLSTTQEGTGVAATSGNETRNTDKEGEGAEEKEEEEEEESEAEETTEDSDKVVLFDDDSDSKSDNYCPQASLSRQPKEISELSPETLKSQQRVAGSEAL
eukprot:TRINITY_DN2355_c0_g1_i5.p1 TRINITY_DN2355_c0_g1~~TRINITY_DN2355_c0_g1_i5.p1  ORF type:complete len:270 (-),score=55.07 TRINITY_DN2355_c0_g1_i5:94-903(-)